LSCAARGDGGLWFSEAGMTRDELDWLDRYLVRRNAAEAVSFCVVIVLVLGAALCTGIAFGAIEFLRVVGAP
jgi:hypothetical protein